MTTNNSAINKKWSYAVQDMWSTQRMLLIMSAAVVLLAIIGTAMLIAMAESQAVFISLIPLSLCGLVGIAAYVYQWRFLSNIKEWQETAPEEDRKAIGLFKTAWLISLIAAGLIMFISMLSVVPVLNIFASIASGLVSTASLVSFVIQFIAINKLRKSSTMPQMAHRGVVSLFKYYITYAISAVLAYILIIVGMVAVVPAILAEDGNMGSFMQETLVNEPDDYYDYYNNDTSYTPQSTFLPQQDNNVEPLTEVSFVIGIIVIILGYIILFVGAVTAMIFYYRGWWLIGKSELEVAPEVIEAAAEETLVVESTEANVE